MDNETSLTPINNESSLEINKEDFQKDYNYSRKTLENIIEQGKTAISDVLMIAQASEDPRAYEVVGSLIKNVGNTVDKLFVLQEKVKNISEPNKESYNTVTNNAVFVGSTNELLEKLFKR